jgi:hypothetical protein
LDLLCIILGKGRFPFALEGINKTERMKERFDVPKDFSISGFLKLAFGLFYEKPITVEVLFKKELSGYIQRRSWHPNNKIKKIPNYRCPAQNLP